MAEVEAVPVAGCPDCGTQWGPSLLACPVCHRLVHGARLAGLAAEAERLRSARELGGALAAWRQALALLPPESGQHATVAQTIDALAKELEKRQAKPWMSPGMKKGLAGAGVVGLLLWKLKAVLLFVLTKGKLLLLGMANAGTLFSIFAALGVYWSLWGWRFALGFLAAMYVHEIGHVSAARRLGIPVTAPFFVPGLGAFVLLKQHPATPREDARLGLAGPLWGGFAALFALVAGKAGGSGLLVAIAHAAAWLNLFNLLPVHLLDGGRGFRALARSHRWWAAVGLALLFLFTKEGLLLVLAAAAVFQATVLGKSAPARAERSALFQYLGLALFLTLIAVASAGGGVTSRVR